jgi:hypothetical protein
MLMMIRRRSNFLGAGICLRGVSALCENGGGKLKEQ